MELYYKATVDNQEFLVSSVEVDGLQNLKGLKNRLIDENDWGDTSKASFYLDNDSSKQLALTTKVTEIQVENSKENPLYVNVEFGSAPQEGKFGIVVPLSSFVGIICFVCSPETLTYLF